MNNFKVILILFFNMAAAAAAARTSLLICETKSICQRGWGGGPHILGNRSWSELIVNNQNGMGRD